jgi:hypothetical protein
MTWLSFSHLSIVAAALSLILHLAAGFGLGLLYFQSLWRNAQFLAAGGGLTTVVVLGLARFILLGGLLALASLEGAPPLLAMALGTLVARRAVMRRVGEMAP